MKTLMTFKRILVEEIPNALARVLPPQAYSEIKGTRKKGMTDTKPHFMRQRIEEIFGVSGHGWWFVVEEMSSEFDESKNNPWTSTCRILFYYRFTDGTHTYDSEPIPGIGGVSMDRKDFSERGAVTNALGDALKQLGWQRGLWFGYYDHKNAGQWYEKQKARDTEWAEQGKHVPGTPVPEPIE